MTYLLHFYKYVSRDNINISRDALMWTSIFSVGRLPFPQLLCFPQQKCSSNLWHWGYCVCSSFWNRGIRPGCLVTKRSKSLIPRIKTLLFHCFFGRTWIYSCSQLYFVILIFMYFIYLKGREIDIFPKHPQQPEAG